MGTRPTLQSIAIILTLLVAAQRAAAGGPLDPQDFASLGSLSLAGGSFSVDTDALEIRDGGGGLLFTGVVDDQDGTADYMNNVWIPGSNGIPEIAVFPFDDIDIQSTATITVSGSRALALLSMGDAFIDTVINLSPPVRWSPLFGGPTRTLGVAGGFDGGDEVPGQSDGEGPGGGGEFFWAAPGSFGGQAFISASSSQPGPTYGDLAFGPLQGGSGGGGQGLPDKGGAAGGGALEVGALGSITLGTSGSLVVAGGQSETGGGGPFHSGGATGSGGGVRLSGRSVNLLGSVDASAWQTFSTGVANGAGGGRVAVFGYSIFPEFIAGTTTPGGFDTSAIDVIGAKPTPPLVQSASGVITIAPQLTTVPFGQSLTLGDSTDLSDATRQLFLIHREFRIAGTLNVPAGGFVQSGTIELLPTTGRVAGSDLLENRGSIRGGGTIEVPLANQASGSLDTIGETLTFTDIVTNESGGVINAIDATLDFQAGLTNLPGSALNLINTTILGSVASTGSAGIAIAGVAIFEGDVSGTADFAGSGTAVFRGGYFPGASPGNVHFDGDVAFESSSTLFAEIGGPLAGTDHDRLEIVGVATLGGGLDLTLIDAFVPVQGESFTLLTHAARSGEFEAISGIAAGALDLAVGYDATTLTVTAALRGDVNLDSVVDALDRTVAEQNLGLVTTAYGAGDVDGSGVVDSGDLAIIDAVIAPPSVPALSQGGAYVLALALILTGMITLPRTQKRLAVSGS